jgi:hypothetical protein
LLPLAVHTAGTPHAGWWKGLVIGFAVVVVLVLVVAFILTWASRINDRTQDALEAFDSARAGTAPLSRLRDTRAAAEDVLTAMRAARDVLRGRA